MLSNPISQAYFYRVLPNFKDLVWSDPTAPFLLFDWLKVPSSSRDSKPARPGQKHCQEGVMNKSIVDRVCRKCYIMVGGEAYAGEKSSNQCRAGKAPLSYHRAAGKQGRCFPLVKGP